VPVTFLGAAKDPWGNARVGFEGEITVNRKEFGLNWNATLETGGFLVGDDVEDQRFAAGDPSVVVVGHWSLVVGHWSIVRSSARPDRQASFARVETRRARNRCSGNRRSASPAPSVKRLTTQRRTTND